MTDQLSNQTKLLNALVEKPTRYTIDVLDNSMLPEKLKNKKTLDFEIKPPTVDTLALCAIHFEGVPKDLLNPEKQVSLTEITPYLDNLIKIICTLSYRRADYDEWCEPFLRKNASPKDMFYIFHESAMKMGTDFFLTSFQIANQMNPMMLRRPKGSTLFS